MAMRVTIQRWMFEEDNAPTGASRLTRACSVVRLRVRLSAFYPTVVAPILRSAKQHHWYEVLETRPPRRYSADCLLRVILATS